MPKLDARTIVLLYNPDQTQVLLLRRSPEKALWPNLITGIGGKVEVILGEASDIRASLLREVAEEVPQLAVEDIAICICGWCRIIAVLIRLSCLAGTQDSS